MAFVHHTDGGNSYTRAQAPGIVRGIYYYHTKSLGWSDIGYNFLIDRYGTDLRGPLRRRHQGADRRPGARASTRAAPASPSWATFTSATPPAAAVTRAQAPARLEARRAPRRPAGARAVLTCGYGQKFATGQRVTFPAIAGHRHANYTSCPGDRLYALLPAVRKAVAGMGLPKIYGFIVSRAVHQPQRRRRAGQDRRVVHGLRGRRLASGREGRGRRDAAELQRHRRKRRPSPGPARTTTAGSCRTASTRSPPAPPAPAARRVPPSPPSASTRSPPTCRAPPSRPTRSAPTATARATSRRCATRPARAARRASRC